MDVRGQASGLPARRLEDSEMRQHKLVLGIILILACACQTAQMQVAPSLASAPAMAVEGANPRRWNTPIRFGPWSTLEAREGLTWQFAHRLLASDAHFATQPYRFALTAGDQPLQGECITRALLLSSHGYAVDPTLGQMPALACGFRATEEGTLRLRATSRNTEEGEVAFAGTTWEVRSVHRLAGSRVRTGDPMGYEVTDRERVLAAVETINHGRVWISPTLEEEDRGKVALVATALLMYKPPTIDVE
jgi:hypothetical protein